MRDPGRTWRERLAQEQRDSERMRRLYGRNILLIILSLGAALLVFVVTKFFGPGAREEIRNPEETKLVAELTRAIEGVDFDVIQVHYRRREALVLHFRASSSRESSAHRLLVPIHGVQVSCLSSLFVRNLRRTRIWGTRIFVSSPHILRQVAVFSSRRRPPASISWGHAPSVSMGWNSLRHLGQG